MMALALDITIYNGEVMRYHRITSYRIHTTDSTVVAVLGSWPSAIARRNPGRPVVSREFTFTCTDPNLRAGEAYAYIKSQPEWSAAVDT